MALESFFMTGYVKYVKYYKNTLDFTNFFHLPPSLLKILNFEARGWHLNFNFLKTNYTKFAHYRLKIRKFIEFFDFQSLVQHPLTKMFKSL